MNCARLRTARAAVRGDRRGVGGRGGALHVDLRHDVHTGRHLPGEEHEERADRPGTRRRRRSTRPFMPTIVPSFVSPSSTYSIWPRPCTIDDHVLGAGLGPLHRPIELDGPRSPSDHVLGVHAALGAEAATDRRRDHAHLIRFEAEQGRDRVAQAVRPLRRDGQGEARRRRARRPCRWAPSGTAASRWLADAHRHHDVGALEHGGIVAEVERRRRRWSRARRTAPAAPSSIAASGSTTTGSGS